MMIWGASHFASVKSSQVDHRRLRVIVATSRVALLHRSDSPVYGYSGYSGRNAHIFVGSRIKSTGILSRSCVLKSVSQSIDNDLVD